MGIVAIFAEHLYAFRYDDEEFDEFERLFDCWNDYSFLEDFFEQNKSDLLSGFWGPLMSVERAVEQTIKEANEFDDLILELSDNIEKEVKPNLDSLFKPLNKTDFYRAELLMTKAYGLENPSWLRMYAIKVEPNVYVITGGGIKLTSKMNDNEHLKKELNKLNRCMNFLKVRKIVDKEGLIDND